MPIGSRSPKPSLDRVIAKDLRQITVSPSCESAIQSAMAAGVERNFWRVEQLIEAIV